MIHNILDWNLWMIAMLDENAVSYSCMPYDQIDFRMAL